MNKTKVLLLSAISVTVAAMAITYAIARGSGDAYATSLPSDATAIARLDASSFLSAAKLGPHDLLQLLRRSRENKGEDDAKSLGIDVKRPVYAFAAASGNFGFLAAVDDYDDLEDYLAEEHAAGRASEVTRQRGYSWVVIGEQWLLAFDGKRALLMGPAVGSAQDQLRTEMARLLEQDAKDSGLQSALYEELKKSDEPLSAVAAPELLPSAPRRFLRQFHVASSNDALLRLSLETDDNELELDIDVVAKSEVVKEGLDRLNQQLRPIKGSLLDFAHTENVAWLAVNVQGNDFLNALRSNPAVRTALIALNLAFDFDRIIRAIDGDLAVELTDASLLGAMDFQFRDLYLTAKVANTDFLKDASSWGNRLIGIQALSQQDFALNFGTTSVYFGVDDKTFYLSGQRGLTAEGNEYLNHKRSDIQDTRLFATFALPEVLKQLNAWVSLPAALRQFERLNVEMEEAGEFRLKFVAPHGMNIARELLLAE